MDVRGNWKSKRKRGLEKSAKDWLKEEFEGRDGDLIKLLGDGFAGVRGGDVEVLPRGGRDKLSVDPVVDGENLFRCAAHYLLSLSLSSVLVSNERWNEKEKNSNGGQFKR